MYSTPLAGATDQSKEIDDLPEVWAPDDYPRTMPSFLAASAQQHGPIFRVRWSDAPGVVHMVGPEANKLIQHTQRECFSHELGWTPVLGEYFGKGLLNMDGEEHTRHRKMMNPAFTIAYMSRYLPLMMQVIERRTSDWARRGQVDLYDEARKMTFDIAAEALVGFNAGPQVDRLRALFLTLLNGDFGPNLTQEQWWQAITPIHDELRSMLLELIARRRAEIAPEGGPTNILEMMIRARDDEGQALTDEQLLAHVNILLVAGHETSTSMAAWLLYLLTTHPTHLARVHAELDQTLGHEQAPITLEAVKAMRVLGDALNEAGRLHSPVGTAPRQVVREVQFGGYTLPVGTPIYYCIAAGHRLPTVFEQPDCFDPDRFAPPREEDKRTPYGFIPFGGGTRICIGINFAQVEIKAMAAHLLRHYTLHPIGGQDIVQIYYGVTGFLPEGARVGVTRRA